ncbi:MAG: hypothetical protein KF746_19535 [Chitinophagaceae bacterium]|nr:hypothetical protein [Chitinophagaceae bacterium]
MFSTETLIVQVRAFAKAINVYLDGQEKQWIQYMVAQQLINAGIANNGKQEKYIYYTQPPDIFETACILRNGSLISHGSAAFLHGLSDYSRNIYISVPQKSIKEIGEATILQENIEAAFKKKQRTSNDRWIYGDHCFIYHTCSEISSDHLTKIHGLPLTTLEKTLVDMAVRPTYSGGAIAILNAYRRAMPSASIEKIVLIMDEMNYSYPYHQAIGFYLSNAGFDRNQLVSLRSRKMKYKFFLDYNMQGAMFDPQWNLYYPADMSILL